MRTPKQIETSRRNGAKSRGPVTPEGKRRASLNARRHGLLAATVVLEAEDKPLFRSLLRDFTAQFQPATPTENALVETMAVARWRQLRAWSLEKAGLDYQIATQEEPVNNTTRAALAFRNLSDNSRSLELLNRYENRYNSQFLRALNSLRCLRETNPR